MLVRNGAEQLQLAHVGSMRSEPVAPRTACVHVVHHLRVELLGARAQHGRQLEGHQRPPYPLQLEASVMLDIRSEPVSALRHPGVLVLLGRDGLLVAQSALVSGCAQGFCRSEQLEQRLRLQPLPNHHEAGLAHRIARLCAGIEPRPCQLQSEPKARALLKVDEALGANHASPSFAATHRFECAEPKRPRRAEGDAAEAVLLQMCPRGREERVSTGGRRR
mmetsp:Transcript_3740/g.9770  ORF Transcript_3740/g.9770 Transcript_3740/m.9770 type:complete len:220 (+) Transcript_3740:724-1383(+)